MTPNVDTMVQDVPAFSMETCEALMVRVAPAFAASEVRYTMRCEMRRPIKKEEAK